MRPAKLPFKEAIATTAEAQWQHYADTACRFALDWASDTHEKNILQLIEPQFLNELREEFKAVRKQEKKLAAFRQKMHRLHFLDPACGCGNFLVVTYRELRLLDLDVVQVVRKRTGRLVANIDVLKNVLLTQVHGLEIMSLNNFLTKLHYSSLSTSAT